MRKLSAKWGPEMPERGSITSMVPVVWATFGMFFFDAIQMISCRDWWPWTKLGYITTTRRQRSNQWSGGIAAHPAPKNSECKNKLEKFSPRFFWIKTASSSLINFQRAKLSTPSIIHLCWCNWKTFEGKTPREGHQGGHVLARQCPGSPGTCNPEETSLSGLPMPWSPTLFSGCWPRRTTIRFLDWKNNWKVAIFRPTRRSLLPRRPGWTDNLLNFSLSDLQKLEQRAKKCIELRGEYVE